MHPSVPTLVLAATLITGCGIRQDVSGTATPSSPPPSFVSSEPPPACTDARFVWVPSRHRLLLANCLDQDDSGALERIWTWDGSAWELLADAGPPGRVVAAVAYDAGRDVLVRYGGLPLGGDTCAPETWEWDGDAWRQTDADPPLACDHAKLAYDVQGGRAILVGGGTAERELVAGTWAWDGRAWRELTVDGPRPRAHHGFVYDESHEQALLYGGYDGSQAFDDFWAWDGETWTELDFPGPGPRSHAGMAVGANGMLLFGGATSASTFASLTDETWYLTDGRWREVEGEAPSPRGLPALGYDPDRDVFVLYGGFGDDGGELADLWEWDGAWRCVSGC